VPELPQVVTVHGLWMTGAEATLFRHRLAACGYAVRQYHYHSLAASVATVLAGLRAEILSHGGTVHLVGHSLGGIVVLRALEAYPELPVGRVVLLAAPVNGSAAAHGLSTLPGCGWLLGPIAEDELLARAPRRWRHPAPVGVIAGTHSLGLGRLVSALAEPNDGTVAVDETRLEGATEQLALPVSHAGFMLSRAVVGATARFLARGSFSASGP
jgi:pimeloyl-ACP methyl ester carboxylesterase